MHDEIEDINRKEIFPHNIHHLSNDLQDDVSSHKIELELDNEEVMILECAENKETFSTAIFKEESHAHFDIQVIDINYVKDTFDNVSNVSSSVGYNKLVVENQLNLDGYLDNEEEIFVTAHVEFLHNQPIFDQPVFDKYPDDEDEIFTLTSIDLRSNDPIFDNYESNFSKEQDYFSFSTQIKITITQ